jgi:hypothetical protein
MTTHLRLPTNHEITGWEVSTSINQPEGKALITLSLPGGKEVVLQTTNAGFAVFKAALREDPE